ncbi:hypothetical protein PLCT2_02911 [Planctomycetaceae bacterium]|nr:hypothetical protein PLCT2_02911 [Planctomycetaceae bacterium]
MKIQNAALLVFVALFGAMLSAQTYALNQSSPVTDAFTSGGAANCQRGWRFQVNANGVTITQMGCWYPDGTSQQKTVSLFNATTQALLAQVTPTAGTGWRWANLTTPVALTNGQQYIVTGFTVTSSYYYRSVTGMAQWMPTGTIQYMDMRYQNSCTSTTFPASTLTNYQYGVVDIGYTTGPSLVCSATAGTAQQVLATDTSSAGRSIGTFTVTNNSSTSSLTLNSMTLAASGTGNDSNAYSEVGIFEDTNSSSAYDAGDTRYGTAATAYPADNGQLTFTASQNFAASQVRRYFVVAKLNGTTLATLGQTFNTTVQALSVTGGTASGAPSTTMNGLVIVAPTLTVSATAGTAQNVYANDTGGGNGVSMGTFTIANGALGSADLVSITLAASGTGNDSAAFSEVRIYEDTNASASYTPGTDQPYGTAATAYPSDNGNLTFTQGLNFTVSQSRTFFVVVKLNGATPAAPGHTFNVQVSTIAVSATSGSAGTPSAVMNGFVILAPSFTFADSSAATQASAYLGGTDFVIQTFTIAYPNGPLDTITSITVQSSGTGNDQNDYSNVVLFRDANANNAYDVGVDTQVNGFSAFPSDNGSQSFTLSGAESQFTAGTTRMYFIVVSFNMNGANNTTFATQLQAASGASTGTTITGLPAPTGGPTAGLNLLANNLNVTLNGPSTATGINNNEQGAGGIGVVLCDVSINTIAAAWVVASITFRSTGTGNDFSAYSYLALHEDGNANGAFDGSTAGDPLAVATAGTAFITDNGDYTATLTNTAFPSATTRRFFLVAKWGGSAVTGEDFSARLQSISGTPPSGGLVTGAPTAYAASFTINAAVLSVSNAPTAPASQMREGGSAFGHALGLFRFAATNNTVTVNAITLTTAGSGNWATDLAANGVTLYADNGNGVFDSGLDTLVFSGAGAAGTLTCTLSTPLVVTNGTTQDLWIYLNVAATAGSSVPETFNTTIANTTDVNATGGTVQFGVPAPTTNTLGVIIFFVTTFAPAYDVQTGGAAITITGSGFIAPITLTIGGAVCPGTAVISGGGTQITGLTVPPGTGSNKVIVLTDGSLGPKTLTQTFDYAGGSTIGTGSGGKGGGGGGCMTGEGHAAWLALLALLAVAFSLGLRRRRA